jgi:predicted ATPase
LKVDAMRAPNQLHPSPSIAPDGSNLAALIAYWELEEPEQLVRFNQIMRDCVPELSRVSVTCTNHGQVSLQFKQRDSQLFGVTEVSDGVLVFAGLIAHALRAPSGALMLMEEPERGIHPRRLGELVDLLRTLVKERGTQFIMATHSPALLNVFNDEPEAILLFSRTPEGTSIRRLSDSPALIETLGRADPGEMLANGVFNEDIGDAADSRDSK